MSTLPQSGHELRNPRFPAAMVAAQRALGLVQHDIRAATRTAGDPAAGVARQDRRVAAPVQEHEALLAAFEARFQRRDERPRQAFHRCPPAPALLFQVDQPDARQHRVGDGAARQRQARVAALVGLPPAFQRRRRRAEHDRNAELLRRDRSRDRAPNSASLPAACRRDRAPRRRRSAPASAATPGSRAACRARCRARPVCAASQLRARSPSARPLCIVTIGVFRQRGEARAERRFELRRQVDFRHEHERLRVRASRRADSASACR